MALPRYLMTRGDTYVVRRPIPLDLQPAYGGRREVWRSLRTTRLAEAKAKSHAVLAGLEAEFEAKRREMRGADEERAFLASGRASHALAEHDRIATRMEFGGPRTAWHPETPEDAERIALGIRTGFLQPRPASRAEAVGHVDDALGELEAERVILSLVTGVDEDGGPVHGTIPDRYVPRVLAHLEELFEADRRTLEAQRAVLAGSEAKDEDGAGGEGGSLAELSSVWKAQRRPAASSQADMRTAIARFGRVNGPLPYPAVTDEHARRFKASLLEDEGLRNATRGKLWGMLRALFGVAVDDGLLDANPFSRVKLKLDDDSERREVLTASDLKALFGTLADEQEWWIARIALYTGARLGEVCQLTRGDLGHADGVAYLHIREDAAAGKSVKTRGSIRKVPLHRQLVADGLLDWIGQRPGEALFAVASAPASKRLNRRMREAGLGEGKVFHSLRHTFKGQARRHMATEWHDRLTGHASKTVGETYGDYDLATLKAKLDLVSFGIEAPAA